MIATNRCCSASMHDAVADRHWSVSLKPMPAHMSRSARIPQKPVLGAHCSSWLPASRVRRPPVLLLLLPASPVWGSARQLSVLPHRGPWSSRARSGARTRTGSPAQQHERLAGTQPRCRRRIASRARSALPVCPVLRPRLDPYYLPADSIYKPCGESETRISSISVSHYHLRSISCLLAFSSPHSPALRNIYFFFKKKSLSRPVRGLSNGERF